MKPSKQVLIVGGGKVGTDLATLLLNGHHHVSVIEMQHDQMTRLQRIIPSKHTIMGSGTDPSVLEQAHIRQMDVVAAVTGVDEVNLVVTNLAHFEFGVPRTIARVNHPQNTWMFTPDMGVDVALNQSALMSHLIAEEMSLGDMLILTKLRRGEYTLIEEQVHSQAFVAGKAIRDAELPSQCVLVAIIRQGQLLIPKGMIVLQPSDHVFVLVHTTQMEALAALLGPMG